MCLLRNLCVTVFAIVTVFGSVNEPTYSRVKPLSFYEMSSSSDAFMAVSVIQALEAKVIVEVGSSLGVSSRILAEALPAEGVMVCVDRWVESYTKFISNIIHYGLQDKIIPLRLSSIEASKFLGVQSDLIYLNASHGTEDVYAELCRWWPKLRDGGVFCGDDWNAVGTAVERFATENHLIIHNSSSDFNAFWYMEPKNSSSEKISPLAPRVLEGASLYSLAAPIPYFKHKQGQFTKQLVNYINNSYATSVILVEPKETVSSVYIGEVMKFRGKVFLIEANVSSEDVIHPFHKQIAAIQYSDLKDVVVPVQMVSREAADFISFSASLIYMHFDEYSDIVDQLNRWSSHLMSGGILCGTIKDDATAWRVLGKYAISHGMFLELGENGFWVIRH